MVSLLKWASGTDIPCSAILPLAACTILVALCLYLNFRPPGRIHRIVKIGLVAPFEGRYRYAGYDVIYAVRMALRQVNAGGGVGGYGVELIAYDDGADPVMAVEQARKLALDPQVVAAIGHFREETTMAAAGSYVYASLPLIAPGVLDPALTSAAHPLFRMGPDASVLANEIFTCVEQLCPVSQAALLTDGGPLGIALQEQAKVHGVTLRPVASPADDDWLAQVLNADVAAVLCDTTPVEAGEVAAALRAVGWGGTLVGGPELAASDFTAVAGQAAQGAIFVTPWFFPGPTINDDVDAFIRDYRQASGGLPPGPLAIPAYEATWVVLEALERQHAWPGEPGRAGVAAALSDVRRRGLLGEITFAADRSWNTASLHCVKVTVTSR